LDGEWKRRERENAAPRFVRELAAAKRIGA